MHRPMAQPPFSRGSLTRTVVLTGPIENMELEVAIDFDEVTQLYQARLPKIPYLSAFGETPEEALEDFKKTLLEYFSPHPNITLGVPRSYF